jgi:CRISPR-associated protein Csm2
MANVKEFIIHDRPKELIEAADSLGKKLVDQRLTTNQIRNLFGMVRQIKMTWSIDPAASYRQAVLLKPKIWYQARRIENKVRGLPDLLEREFIPALDAVIEAPEEAKQVRFERFTDYFEAVVAYHKRYGGKDS